MKQSNFGKSTEIYALHGFLGRPSDWSFISGAKTCDLFSEPSLIHEDFTSWANWFNQQISSNQSKILIGYSLGGRLALHALKEDPEKWSAAVIISANTGLDLLSMKKNRLEQDAMWASRFLKDPWDKLIHDWNSQAVFKREESHPVRDEGDFNREKLAKSLTQWSLGRQDDLRDEITHLPIPILWIYGEYDKKPVKLSHPNSKIWVAPQGSHRVIWTHQELILNEIESFKESL